MAATLPPTFSSPFDANSTTRSCRLDTAFTFPNAVVDLSVIKIPSTIRDRIQQSSPGSIFSVASAPTFKNNENEPPILGRKNGAVHSRSISTQVARCWTKEGFQGQIRPRNFTYQPLSKEVDVSDAKDQPLWPGTNTIDDNKVGYDAHKPGFSRPTESTVVHNALQPFTPVSNKSESWGRATTGRFSRDGRASTRESVVLTPETGLLSRIRELSHQSANKNSDLPDASPTRNADLLHQQRSSDSSSGFIHSIKTASMTNASFSIYPRASRLYRSSDSHPLYGSQPRASVDSERPWSSSSIDDASLKRGFERQQIIDELVTTEEGYVADLKALLHLYSTILTSTSSLSSRIGSAVLRNVNEILCLHERMLRDFHAVRLRAAARRWADTATPDQLAHQTRPYVRSLDRADCTQIVRARRCNKSVSSTQALDPQTQQISYAEPIDVYEITTVFKNTIRDFYVYEEYCANYEFIGHELQNHAPASWPILELGMESLARAIVAIDQRDSSSKKGLTVSDLLIKPIQRMTKYPLLLEQLLYNTPVSDAPGTHAELDMVLQSVRDAVQMINLATENHFTRLSIQRRWLLRDRVDLSRLGVGSDKFKGFGTLELCGVLHVAYQSVATINGGYAVCAVFEECLIIAFPPHHGESLEAVAIIRLDDIRIVPSTDGKGLQCASTLFTWKISFACAGHFHELIFSGCSKTEEDVWVAAMRGEFGIGLQPSVEANNIVTTCIAFDLKSAGVVFTSQSSLSRDSSIQRAATVARRTSISQVIVRNTHNVQDLQGYRDSNSHRVSINRSQSHATTKRIPVLEPKRSERTRLENSIADIWTKEVLPFPGMVGSRGGQIIRASAGSLVRKLSLASIHAPFSKSRTASLSTVSRKSYDMFNESKSNFEIHRRDAERPNTSHLKPKEIPEVDDMRSVVGRMIGVGLNTSKRDTTWGLSVASKDRSKIAKRPSLQDIGPDDPATIFYENSTHLTSKVEPLNTDTTSDIPTANGSALGLVRVRRKRWSNPITKLIGFGSEAIGLLQLGSSRG